MKIKCTVCKKTFTRRHHANTVCSRDCIKKSHLIRNRKYFLKNKKIKKEEIINCKMCGISFIKKGSVQIYCGNRKIKSSCSYKAYRILGDMWNKTHQFEPKIKFNHYRRAARLRKKEFTLTFQDFMKFFGKPCTYCGDEIICKVGLDRIDNNKGYTVDNITSCCEWCNTAKRQHTVKLFLEKCAKVVKNNKSNI